MTKFFNSFPLRSAALLAYTFRTPQGPVELLLRTLENQNEPITVRPRFSNEAEQRAFETQLRDGVVRRRLAETLRPLYALRSEGLI